VHARLKVGGENSGKLVTRVRAVAHELAEDESRGLLIVDGSPGIGCPVIASVTGADLVLVVTEPTRSGMHDLERVVKLTSFMEIPTVVCINKWDINPEITTQIEKQAGESGVHNVGKISYDKGVTAAQLMKSSVVEYTGGLIAQEINALWRNIIYPRSKWATLRTFRAL
jgi:MinD superfamily P-loop ATPase